MLNYITYENDLHNLGIVDENEQREIIQSLYNFALVACEIYLKRDINNHEESNHPIQGFG